MMLHDRSARAEPSEFFLEQKLQLGVWDDISRLALKGLVELSAFPSPRWQSFLHGKLPYHLTCYLFPCPTPTCTRIPPSNDDKIHLLLFTSESTMKQHSGPLRKGPVTCQYFLSDFSFSLCLVFRLQDFLQILCSESLFANNES
ncbi:hypothetical protein IF1G_00087 [Cordyceps javanica]|uniref:Uncharacterized protein n=1 Tax=Cordyceps javanica TaxID=43265 RepID=A0A545WBM1_9HYPO|nr:hypothetical protein IF1G_00087 [Cordyceps javanica]TQW11358.1 hypothetical protein IF2G_00089 [Cordyceps javanica]